MKKPDRYFYPAVFIYDPNAEISVFFPDLDVATSGIDEEDALLSARELLGITMFGLEEDNEVIPQATPLENIKEKENEKTVLIDVYMPTIRLSEKNKSINRTVTLPAWLNAKALESGVNVSQLLQDALKEFLNIPNKHM